MNQHLGALVIDEIIVPVTRIYLDEGQIKIEGRVVGPVPDVDTTKYTLHDPDGRVVLRGMNTSGLCWHGVNGGRELVVEAKYRVVDRMTEGVPAP